MSDSQKMRAARGTLRLLRLARPGIKGVRAKRHEHVEGQARIEIDGYLNPAHEVAAADWDVMVASISITPDSKTISSKYTAHELRLKAKADELRVVMLYLGKADLMHYLDSQQIIGGRLVGTNSRYSTPRSNRLLTLKHLLDIRNTFTRAWIEVGWSHRGDRVIVEWLPYDSTKVCELPF